MTTTNFAYTGAAQSFTVPAYVYSIDVALRGAGGASNQYGAYASLSIPVQPGDVLQINCGGTPARATPRIGGWNGGADGGTGSSDGDGGCGATDIRIGGTALANRIAVAGGRGGNCNADLGGPGQGADNTAGGTAATAGADRPSGTILPSGGGGGGGGWNGGAGGVAGTSGTSGRAGHGGTSHCATSAPRGATSNPVIRGNDSTASGDGSATLTYVVQTPTAPTPMSPLNNVDRDASLAITLRAVFFAPSPAAHVAAASFRYKAAGAGSWTTVAADTIADPNFSYAFAPNALTVGVAIEWQAQTTDNFGNTGAWSTSWFFTPRAVPVAPTITTPASGDTILSVLAQPITISATTGQTDTQYRRASDTAGTVVYEDSGSAGNVTSHTFTDGAVHPAGAEHWQARVRTNSTLWSAWGDVAIDAEIAAPPVPLLTLTLLDGPSVEVQVVNPAPVGLQSATDHTDVYRTGPDGNRIRIAAGLAANGVVTDWWPGAGDNDYQAIAYSANGASAGSA